MAKRNPRKGSCVDASPHRSFLDEAQCADIAMQESGVGYAMPDVHAYVEAKVCGKRVKRPSPVKWQK